MAKRNEFNDNLKWDVLALFATEEDYYQEYKKLEQDLNKFKKFQNHILDNADTLYELVSFDTDFSSRLEVVYVYAHIQNDQDTTDVKYQKMYGEAYNLYQRYIEATSFITPELLKSDYAKVEEFIKETPKLKEYERTLKEIYKYKNHTLSSEEEQIISSLHGTFSTPEEVFSYLTDADMEFGKIKNERNVWSTLNETTYHKYIESKDRKVRKRAFNRLLKTYGKYKNTYAALLSAEVKKNNKLASIKKYDSALDASLYANDIPTKIYDNLIQTVKANVSPLSEFWQIKQQALGVKELHLYDTYAPIVKKCALTYSEKEAQELLLKSLSVLGETYINDLKKAFNEHWIDFCPNDNKRGGAYCTACYKVHPYVLLSYDKSLNSVSTLAHELGHAMHYYYAINTQKYQDYSYSIFVAEVASQVNQILLSKYLINNTKNKEVKKYLIDDLIQDFKSTIYRQTMFAEFEKIIHEKEAQGEVLTHEVMCETYYKLNQEYMGDNIVVDDEIRYEWERIPHFYMNYYVYQYATAYAAAIKIANDLLNKKAGVQEAYLEFLSLGSTKTPIESLKIAGVDMAKPEVLEDAFIYFEDLVKSLDKLMKEGK